MTEYLILVFVLCVCVLCLWRLDDELQWFVPFWWLYGITYPCRVTHWRKLSIQLPHNIARKYCERAHRMALWERKQTYTQTMSVSPITHTRFMPHYPGSIFVKQPQEKCVCVCVLVCICVCYSLNYMFGHVEKKNQEYKEDFEMEGGRCNGLLNILEDCDDCGSDSNLVSWLSSQTHPDGCHVPSS